MTGHDGGQIVTTVELKSGSEATDIYCGGLILNCLRSLEQILIFR